MINKFSQKRRVHRACNWQRLEYARLEQRQLLAFILADPGLSIQTNVVAETSTVDCQEEDDSKSETKPDCDKAKNHNEGDGHVVAGLVNPISLDRYFADDDISFSLFASSDDAANIQRVVPVTPSRDGGPVAARTEPQPPEVEAAEPAINLRPSDANQESARESFESQIDPVSILASTSLASEVPMVSLDFEIEQNRYFSGQSNSSLVKPIRTGLIDHYQMFSLADSGVAETLASQAIDGSAVSNFLNDSHLDNLNSERSDFGLRADSGLAEKPLSQLGPAIATENRDNLVARATDTLVAAVDASYLLPRTETLDSAVTSIPYQDVGLMGGTMVGLKTETNSKHSHDEEMESVQEPASIVEPTLVLAILIGVHFHKPDDQDKREAS